jgi:hypothetical protein
MIRLNLTLQDLQEDGKEGGIWQVLEKDSKKKMIGIILNDSEKILKFFFD